MNFTFAIPTDYSDLFRLDHVLQSIHDLNIPNYEILLLGPVIFADTDRVKYIHFSDNEKPKWVTRKKNVLVSLATYDNVVLFHDYFVFDKDWYKNYLEFGEDWDVCSNAQLLINGKRHFTDWVTWDSPIYPRYSSLNYDDWTHTKYMYQSGGYMLVKKKFMSLYPMNEDMMWGTAEDVEWSLRMRDKALWKCNGKSIVKHNKRHRDVQ